MALKDNKWKAETYLRATNSGKGALEFSMYLTANPDRRGKVYTINPNSEVLIQVKDLLPVTVEELSKLHMGQDISITVHVPGPESAQFNLVDEGPYRSEVAARKYENEAQRIVDYYQEALNEQDFYTMKQIINTPIPEQWKVSPAFYSGVCFLKAKMLRTFLRLPEAEVLLEQGYEGFTDKWAYCFEWVSTLQLYIMMPGATAEQKGKGLQKAIDILGRMRALVKGMKHEKYYNMAASCLTAFLLCYLDEYEQASAQFDDFDFTPLTPEQYNDKDLGQFFTYLAFGFWTALELKDGVLLRNLSSIISTGYPDMLQEPSPVRCHRKALSNAAEKGVANLDAQSTNLTTMAHQYAPELPNLRHFVTLLNSRDEDALDKFIPFLS